MSAGEVTQIKELAMSTIDRFESNYAEGIFAAYPAWTTRYGVELSSIGDALQFLSFHEGMHTGYIMALKRVVACRLV